MLGDKDRLNQVFLAVFLKEEAENIALSMPLLIFNVVLLCQFWTNRSSGFLCLMRSKNTVG